MSVEGDPASAILDVAATEHVDLIAMGTHGRSGLPRWALGSVAERVLRANGGAAAAPPWEPGGRRPSLRRAAEAALSRS